MEPEAKNLEEARCGSSGAKTLPGEIRRMTEEIRRMTEVVRLTGSKPVGHLVYSKSWSHLKSQI